MNKLIFDLNKIFVKPNPVNIIYAYDLLKNFDTNEWKYYTEKPKKGYVKKNLLLNDNKFKYDLFLYSWCPHTVNNEKFSSMSVYKVLQGNLYQFENSYEGTLGVKNSVKYINYANFHSLQTNSFTYSLHIFLKN